MPENTLLPRGGIGINVKRLLTLRGRLMALVFAAIFVPAAAAIMIAIDREYYAVADFAFKSTMPQIMDQRVNQLSASDYVNFVNTQISIITGPTILRRVLNDPEVSRIPHIAQQADPIAYLISHIEAETSRQSELVKFRFRDENRDTAILVLNKVIEEYVAYQEQEELERTRHIRRTLLERETDLKTSLEQQRQEISQYYKELGVPFGDQPGSEPVETEAMRVNLSQAVADLTTAEAQKRQSEKMIARIKTYIADHRRNPTQPVYALGVERQVAEDPRVMLLNEQLADVQQQFVQLEENYVADAPQVQVRRAERDALQRKLEEMEADVRAQVLESLLAQYEYELAVNEADIDDALEREQRFTELLLEYQEENLELSSGLAEIDEMERRYEDTREFLRTVWQGLVTQEIESNAPARVSVLNEATAPVRPDPGQQIKALLVALLGAITLAAGLGVLMERVDQNIRSAQDLNYVTQAPVLASIPHTAEDRLPGDVKVSTLVEDFPGSATADEVRRSMARLLHAGQDGETPNVCLVTSPVRGDGKTSFACNLAISLAQAGRRVLLIDVDSGDPSVEEQFNLERGPGLMELLAGDENVGTSPQSRVSNNLYVMGPGFSSTGLTENLGARSMRDFLDGSRDLFEHIIIDTPAVLLSSEAKLLGPLADIVLLVVGAGVSQFGMVRRAISVLGETGAAVSGLVLNGVRQTPGGYLRRNIEMFYEEKSRQPSPSSLGSYRTRGGDA